MRIIFTSIFGAGHFNPLVPYALEMQRRGHEVRVAAPLELADKIKSLGLIHVPVGRPTEEEKKVFFAKTDHLPPTERTPYLIGGLFVGLLPSAAYPDLKMFADDFQPDLIVREAGEYSGALAAEVLGIPHARVSVSNGHSMKMAFIPFDALRQENGLLPDNGASLRYARAFSAFPASMEPADADGADLPQYRVASSVAPTSAVTPDWVSKEGYPGVYITFGTVMGSSDEAKAIFRAVLDAVATMDVNVLMTTGPSMDVDALGQIPKNVILNDYVPQNDVFPHVSAVICHGGSGSVLGALAAGLPLLVTPIGADQPDNARAVEMTGAGLAVDTPDAGTIAAALKSILEEPAYSNAAADMATEIAAHNSIEAAVTEMLSVVGHN